jgi:hypothetical protein
MDAEGTVRIGEDRHPAGPDQPVEACQEVTRIDAELLRQVMEGASKHVAARDDLEEPRLNEKVRRERMLERAAVDAAPSPKDRASPRWTPESVARVSRRATDIVRRSGRASPARRERVEEAPSHHAR